jgi:hypothetical protein
VALNAATQPSDYAEAEKHLARAIVARPDFAEAYRLRASARFLRGSPQYVTAASLTTPAALQGTLADSRMARALGLRTSGSLGSQGFNMFLLGMRTNRPELLREALEITRTAVAASPDSALVRFNLGVTLLGAERVQEARTEYRRALELLLGGPESDHGFVVSGALTDLELVARYGAIGLTDDVRDIKELIVGSVARGTVGGPASKARLQDVTASVAPGWAEVSIAGAKRLPDKAMLSVHWYHEEPQGLGWSSVEQLQFLASEPYRGEGGALSMTSEYVPWAKRCLPSGRYRVEVYHDGSLLGSATTRYDGHGVMAFVDEDHGVVGCRLASWKERRVESPLVRSYVSKDARSGLHLLRLDRAPVPVDADDEAASRQVVERVLGTVVRTPAGPRRYRGATPGNIFGLTDFTHEYTYRGGRVYAAAGLDEDGSMVVAIVFGPAGAFRATDVEPISILSSLARTDYVARPDAR